MKKNRDEVKVGLFVILGVIILSLIVFFVSGVYLFRPGYALNVLYDYVSILDKGAPVRMAGVRIGEVSKVELYYDSQRQHTRVKVKLFITKGVEIKDNYEFQIQGTHILSEPHIEINPISGGSVTLRDGQVIEGITPMPVEALIDRAQRIAKNLDDITANFHDALQDQETAASLKKIVINLGTLTESLQKSLGGSEQDVKQTLTNLKTSTDALNEILETAKNGKGTVGGLLMKDEIYKDMRELVADVKAHPWKLLKKDHERRFLFF